MKLKIALAQIDPVLGDLAKNVASHVDVAKRAVEMGAAMVLFPELSLTGYSIKDMNWDLAMNLDRAIPILQPLVDVSKEISIIAGGVEEDSSFRIYNSAFLMEDGVIRSAHRKTYPPTYGLFEEMRYFSKGNTIRAIDTKHGRLGVLICEDLWHPSLPYLLACDGAQLIVGLVASPTRVDDRKESLSIASANRENHKAYARLLSVYIVVCNRVGFEDGVNFWGGSEIIAPSGEVVVSAKLFEEDLVVAAIDEHEVRRARRFSRHALDEDSRLVEEVLGRIRNDRNT